MPTERLPLTARQTVILSALGASLFLLAALMLRALADHGIYVGWGRVLLYALVIPGTAPFIFLLKQAAGLAKSQVAVGTAVATAAAILLDGIALAWFPGLYGTNVEHIAGAGAAILWGGGVGLVLGFLMNRAA
jgi:hypothetical protein